MMESYVLSVFGLPQDESLSLLAESALEWIAHNTTLSITGTGYDELIMLPASARLFVKEFVGVLNRGAGVQSESIEGLSQTFTTDSVEKQIWALANQLLMPWLRTQCRFIPSQKYWT